MAAQTGKRITLLMMGYALIGVLILVGIRLWSDLGGGVAKKGGKGEAPAPVAVEDIKRGPIATYLRVSGSMYAESNVTIVPEVSGVLTSLKVDVGDEIRSATIIGTIDRSIYQHELAKAQADVAVANATIEEAASTLELTASNTKRTTLLVSRGVAAAADAERSHAEHLAAKAKLSMAKAQLAQAQAQLLLASDRLANTTLRVSWPINPGATWLVGQRWVDAGATLQVGQPIVSVVNINTLRGEIFITETHYTQIKVGQTATITCDAYPDETFEASVTHIAPQFNTNTRQTLVKLKINNSERKLKPGMFMRATLTLGKVENATLVPYEALVDRGGSPSIYVLNDDQVTVRYVPVRLGLRGDTQVQVLDESITGKVVTLGHYLIKDGSAVTIPSAE